MPMPAAPPSAEEAKRGLAQYAKQWGESPLPPTILATLIAAQHLRPFQVLPMIFPPVFLFASYLNINGFPRDSAGIASAWSAAYFVLARRRRYALRQRVGLRGLVRGATMGLCAIHAVAGGWTYFSSKAEDEGGE